jgi:hypothetical protein
MRIVSLADPNLVALLAQNEPIEQDTPCPGS